MSSRLTAHRWIVLCVLCALLGTLALATPLTPVTSTTTAICADVVDLDAGDSAPAITWRMALPPILRLPLLRLVFPRHHDWTDRVFQPPRHR